MRRILLGCTLVAFALIFGVQVASAQESGPPQSKLVPIPSDYDTKNAKLVDTDDVIYLLTKDIYRREIYTVATPPEQPQTKYAVKETNWVTQRVPVQLWYEVKPLHEPTAKWKYEIRK